MTAAELFGIALVADIGPQACRFALLSEVEGDRPLFSHTAELAVSEHRDVVAAFAAYLATLGRPAPAILGLAVAAPVNAERFVITQSGWSFSAEELRAAFGFETVVTINEAAATALSLEWLGPGDTLAIGGSAEARSPLGPGRYAIVSPDFGLGVSAVEVGEGGGYQVIDTEGGHMAFAPSNALEIELLQRLTPSWGRVSYERVISWPGLAELYSVMAEQERGRAEAWSPLEILLQAREGADPLCQKAVQCFLGILGGFAGDVALAVGANRGVFLAGRFVQEAAELIGSGPFRARFESKGRLSAVVGALPTWAVVARSSVLNGVARQLLLRLQAERGAPSPARTVRAARAPTVESGDPADLVATLLDGAGCGLLVLDAGLRIVLTNERYWEGSSVRRALRAPGCPIGPCFEALAEGHDWSARDAASVLGKLAGGQPFTAERKALGGRVLRDEARPVPSGGWVFTALDITLSRRRAVELEALTLDLRVAKQQADDASHAKTAFLATMSHEIRTPLNGVLGMAQAMAQDDLAPAQAERLDVIRQSGEALLAILNDILDLSKIEAGKLDLEQTEFDIGQLLQGANSSFTGLAHGKGLSFSLRIEPRARGRYLGDPTRVRQIVYNLVSNALKFTASGEIQVVADRVEEALRITVTDTGIGIPADRLEALFEKFVQADVSTTRRYGGTGLGLAICRELTQMMGGTIAVRSEVDRGTSFQVDLPLARLGEAAATGPAPADRRPAAAMAVKVLAAEDNTVNQLVLKTILGQIGADLTVVDDGQQAVDAWERERWDVILMDVQMPVMDGPTAARRIRSLEDDTGRTRTPILALTANVMTHQTTAYLAAGMDGCVAKPIQITALLEALAEACGPPDGEQRQG